MNIQVSLCSSKCHILNMTITRSKAYNWGIKVKHSRQKNK